MPAWRICTASPDRPYHRCGDGRGSFDLLGDGLPSSTRFGAHGGSTLPAAGGTIRVYEVASTEPIRHALKVTIDLIRWGKDNPDGRNAWVFPARTADCCHDYGHLRPAGNTGAPVPMGGLLAIPPSVNIDSLGLETAFAKRLAWTLQNYGAYVVDNSTTDDGQWTEWDWHWEHGATALLRQQFGHSTAVGPSVSGGTGTAWYRDNLKLMDALQLVTNNTPTSKGGGGTPRQPALPPPAIP